VTQPLAMIFAHHKRRWRELPITTEVPVTDGLVLVPARQLNWKDRVVFYLLEDLLEQALDPAQVPWDAEASRRWQVADACLVAGFVLTTTGCKFAPLDEIIAGSFDDLLQRALSAPLESSLSALSPSSVDAAIFADPACWGDRWPKIHVSWHDLETMELGDVLYYAYELLMSGGEAFFMGHLDLTEMPPT
jgi:hypothetical protein